MKATVLGHPFANIGMGEQMRCCIRALQALSVEVEVVDIYEFSNRSDPNHEVLLSKLLTTSPKSDCLIFNINGDEVLPTFRHLAARGIKLDGQRKVIIPAWELPRYPAEWAEHLTQFDSIWCISQFVQRSLEAYNLKTRWVGQSCEVPSRNFLPRRYFGIRDSAFVLLNFFDLSSYATRKNPEAVLEAFDKLLAKRPYDDLQLVLKVKTGESAAEEWNERLKSRADSVKLITTPLSTFETHSLISCSDCFVSLHRSEGFGRGTAEAMYLGKIAMATGWSGNLDYMSSENSLLVNYVLKCLKPEEYPFGSGQVWAEADIDHAVFLIARLLDAPHIRNEICKRARSDAILRLSHRAVGLRMLEALTHPQTN